MSARKAIALLTCNASLGDDYQGALRLGVEQACRERDLELWVYAGRNNWDHYGDQHQLFGLLDPTRIDGVVMATGLISSFTPLGEVIQTIRERCPVPLCAVGERHADVPSLVVDNERGVTQAIDHLVGEHDRRQFVVIAGPEGHVESSARVVAARSALQRHGISLSDDRVLSGQLGVGDGRDALLAFLDSGQSVDAVVAVNDNMALGAIEALERRDRGCPDQVAVIGFDDAASARFASPPLTTIRQPALELGRRAVESLVAAWQGSERASVTLLDTELVIRESCGCSSTRRAVAPTLPPGTLAERLGQLLRPLFAAACDVQHWVEALTAALAAAQAGEAGELSGVFLPLMASVENPRAPLDQLQRVVSTLRSALPAEISPELDVALQVARMAIGNERYRRVGAAKLRGDQMTDELKLSAERLSRSLSLDVLRDALSTELPRLGVREGCVALRSRKDAHLLEPLLCLRDGRVVDGELEPYADRAIVPDVVARGERRRSLTVLPLTCEMDQLGVAALELPLGSEAIALLREQISASVKAVRLHEEILARERLHAQVQQEQRATQERLRSLNLIAGSVAHDLNNALGPLVALPETIRQELEVGASASEEVYEDLESIRLAGLRASHTIRDLFVLGRPEQAPKSRFDLNRLLRSHGEELSRLCGQSSIRFRLDPDPGPLVVRASKSQVISAVSNLIQNAVDAIADSGVIVVRARARRVPDPAVGGHLAEGEYAVIEVVDSGSGIAADLLPHIHEPFFSASARKTGSKGLGLAIVQRLMRDSGGYLDVQSELGRGSTFSLYFPLLVEDSARSSVPGSRPKGGKERILVVDDEPVQLRTASRILAQLGYDVAVAGSGEEAVTACSGRGDRDAFDLLIVDMVMPGGLNGLATVAQIRRRRPVQRALIASGYAPQHLSSAAAREGLPWLAKPYTLAGLAAAVRNAIRRDSCAPDDPSLASEQSG